MQSIKFRQVKKIYPPQVTAVRDVTFSVEGKAFIVLVGPSGCGKTTLLRMTAGLESITEGEIEINGQIVNDLTPQERHMGMVFQNYALYPQMNVYHNMGFGLKTRGVSQELSDRKIRTVAERLGLTELLERYPKELSGGQKQRVAIGGCLTRDAQLYLLDEPLSNLDAAMRAQMRAWLAELYYKTPTSFLYVTHDQIEAMTLGTRIVVMKEGEIQQIADPKSLYHQPQNIFVAQFIGSPKMNLLDMEIRKDHKETALFYSDKKIASIHDDLGMLSRKVKVGVRPEDLWIGNENSAQGGTGVIRYIEKLGRYMILYIEIGESEIRVKCPADRDYRVGEKIHYGFSVHKLHFFDPDTEKRLNLEVRDEEK